jgi:hypothetical protein
MPVGYLCNITQHIYIFASQVVYVYAVAQQELVPPYILHALSQLSYIRVTIKVNESKYLSCSSMC